MLKLIKLETRLKELTFNGRNNNLWVNIFYYKQHLNHLNKYFKSAPKIININDFENKILKNIISNENKKKLLTYYYKYNKLNSYALISQVTRDEEEKIIDILKSVNHDHFITYKLPRPQYPLISIILKPFAGKQIFPPINLVEIASFLRKSLGSGITIRTKDKKIIEQNLKSINNSQLIALLDGDNGTFKTNNYKNILNNHFYLTIEGSLDNKPLTKTYFTNYNNFYKAINNITNLVKSQAKISWIKLYKNINLSKYIEDQNSDSYGNAKTSSDNFKLLAVRMVSGSKISDIKSKLEELKSKLSIVYTLVLNGKKDDILYQKKFLIRFGDFPSFKKILQRHEYKNISYNKVMLYESKILKYKPNSRELIDFSQIPERVRKAYILVEDDNFYFQAWGVDPIGIIKASLNYVVYHQKKGNASVIEQVYEMYLGKQDKTPFDKFTQLLGAFYLSHYADSRDQFVNLYVQSIPGSFIRDHNYGIKGIIKNYLSKDSLDDLTDKELAWLTRIALRPNEFGQDYVRFLNIKKKLKEYNINIPIGNDIKKFNKQVSKFIKRIKFEVRGILQEKGLSNINNKIVNQFLEIRNLYKLYGKNVLKTKDGINFLENNNLSQESFIELVKEVNEIELIDVNAKTLESLRKSYHATEARINTALNEFRKGNEFMSPLITEKEYQIAKKEEIDFNPSIYLNEYQSYTDQTKKDLY
ncbi:MAG: transglycosylase domain-containing protein, partial [Spirochaetota bacterium]|nr:transglycosylase domain-containing protein [Spirochaetota bacterium]